MLGMDSNYYQVVKDALAGERAIDEQALTAVEILRDRLERLKKADRSFAGVVFSPFVQQLAKRQKKLAVG